MYEIYTVESLDDMKGIAKKYGTTEGVLYQINGLNEDVKLSPGMQIIVPVDTSQPYTYYTVKKGDNLYQIARNNDIDYQLLLKLNGLDDNDYIYPNQTIILPKKGLKVYLTKEDDTLNTVMDNLKITLDELIKENDKIYLRPEQIIVFRDK